MLLGLNQPTFLKSSAHLAMTLVLVALQLLVSLPTNQMLVPVKQLWDAEGHNSGSTKEYTSVHLINLLIFLGFDEWFVSNIIVGVWAMILFTVGPMPPLDSEEPNSSTGLLSSSFPSWLLFLLTSIFTLTLSFVPNILWAPKTA